MRIAALVFGILAGLVASLILALGGLDVSATAVTAGDRQAALFRFGLFVLANLGVFAAALTLALPRLGAVFAIVAAIAWVIAALLLGHGLDFILITPPALLLISAAFGIIASIQSPAPRSVAHLPLDTDPEDEETDEEREAALSADPTALTLDIEPNFTRSSRSQPVAIEAEFGDFSRPAAPTAGKWKPGKDRPVPPRATPNFRDPDEDEDDEYESETVFSRIGRNAGSLLSFLLYGALAAAAVLIFWTLRTGSPTTPAVAVIDSSSPPQAVAETSSSEPTLVPILPSSSPPPSVSVAALPPPSLPAPSSAPPSVAQPVDLLPGSAATAALDVPVRLDPQTGMAFDEASASINLAQPPSLPPDAASAPSSAPAAPADTAASTTPVMPFTMSPRMAAARLRPVPSTPPPDTTGL